MLFGLCCAIGFRLSMKKSKHLEEVRSILSEMMRFSDRITTNAVTLEEIAQELNGTLAGILRDYLDSLRAGKRESEAAEHAVETLHGSEKQQSELCRFLSGLSTASRSGLIERTQMLIPALKQAEAEAEEEANRARVLRISGVLIGAGLAILLL